MSVLPLSSLFLFRRLSCSPPVRRGRWHNRREHSWHSRKNGGGTGGLRYHVVGAWRSEGTPTLPHDTDGTLVRERLTGTNGGRRVRATIVVYLCARRHRSCTGWGKGPRTGALELTAAWSVCAVFSHPSSASESDPSIYRLVVMPGALSSSSCRWCSLTRQVRFVALACFSRCFLWANRGWRGGRLTGWGEDLSLHRLLSHAVGCA